ncbi:zinc knuckle domain protein [Aspergillus foveolatus]|uniref:zinc knuckle domain protein n=1 Tax=Aspergillus foveolatus TaxID=210207 RepID=UPI003CCD1F47
MQDIHSDEEDSRNASLAAQRNRGSASASASNPSRHASPEPPSKRRRRGRGKQDVDVQDFVPKGATFSATSLEIDPESESTSASESESESGSESESESESDSEKATEPEFESRGGGVSAPAPNWNKTGKSVIRTSLHGRQAANANLNGNGKNNAESESAAAKKFEAVNGMYWRSRSSSASPGWKERKTVEDGKSETAATDDNDVQMEDGEVNGVREVSADSQSDDSGSLDSEADDSIMLNIGSQGQNRSQHDVIHISDDDSDSEGDGYDPESLSVSQTPATVNILDGSKGDGVDGESIADSESKERALLRFAQKYPTTPSILADLTREDMELQARIVFYNRDINDIELQLPITCMECLQEGHLAEVCPTKECVHCGAWNKHQSSLCPKFRRCQRCRGRGHDAKECPSALKSSASEIPCDLCGSADHLEFDCDYLWKLPRQDTTSLPVLVSISCAHCTSNRHLIGDCPSLSRPFLSSSFTVRGIDPNLITNINSVVNPRRGGAGALSGTSGRQRGNGLKIRGRADQRAHSPSSDSDDMMSMSMTRGGQGRRGGAGGNRSVNRGSINIRIGGDKSNGGPPPSSARDYRDRDDPYFRGGFNSRQRSMSPGRDRGRPGRGRGRGGQQPPRSPPRGQGRPPGLSNQSRGGRGNGKGGGGRGGRGGGGGDAYRPMPSAAKKAWDKYRL